MGAGVTGVAVRTGGTGVAVEARGTNVAVGTGGTGVAVGTGESDVAVGAVGLGAVACAVGDGALVGAGDGVRTTGVGQAGAVHVCQPIANTTMAVIISKPVTVAFLILHSCISPAPLPTILTSGVVVPALFAPLGRKTNLTVQCMYIVLNTFKKCKYWPFVFSVSFVVKSSDPDFTLNRAFLLEIRDCDPRRRETDRDVGKVKMASLLPLPVV